MKIRAGTKIEPGETVYLKRTRVYPLLDGKQAPVKDYKKKKVIGVAMESAEPGEEFNIMVRGIVK